MNRQESLERIENRSEPWDVAIIGGGATGVGCLLDAASRGLDAVLIEAEDFGSGTSSKSTKLIHGGVRYLEQKDVSLVREALRERGLLRSNAADYVEIQEFVVPCFSFFEKAYYGVGLKLYDMLSGKLSFGKSRLLSKSATIDKIPGLKSETVSGGVSYFDGRFDDTEMLLRMVDSASRLGGCPVNYLRFQELNTKNNKIQGFSAECGLTSKRYEVEAKVVVNATGIFADEVRRASKTKAHPLVQWSQGIHVVLDRTWLDTDQALMIPKTSDGRLIFAIPFYGKVLVGTTDTKIEEPTMRPKPLDGEIDFLLETFGQVIGRTPAKEDIRSVFSGIRPLVNDPDVKNTAKLSRGHFVEADSHGLVTITGGKWTTFRNMSEEAIDLAIELSDIDFVNSATKELHISAPEPFETLGLETVLVDGLPWTYADVIRSTRFEMAETIEDILARRTRILFLDVNAALEVAPVVAQLMASELGKDAEWIDAQLREFKVIASDFTP